MRILVRIHGYLASSTGLDSVEIDTLQGNETVEDVLRILAGKGRRGSEAADDQMLQQALVTVNCRIATLKTRLRDGDVVDVLPPAIGG